MGRDLVLIGGGHAHLHTLHQARGIQRRGHRVTLINPQPSHYYSGMAPGMLGGHYSLDDIRFPLAEMAEQSGFDVIWGKVVQVEGHHQRLILESRRCINYDVLSINVGSEVVADIAPELHRKVFQVKPVERLADLRKAVEGWAEDRPCRISVVGGGAAGVEVAGNLRRLMDRSGVDGRVVLISGDRLLPGWSTGQVEKIREYFVRHSIELKEGVRVTGFQRKYLTLDNDREQMYDLAVIATGIRPPKLFLDSALTVGADGGLSVNPFLQSVDFPEIFAAGDCIHFAASPLDKVGVYAVRQGPVLTHNLIAALEQRPLSTYSPQQSYLQILNLGDGRAVLKRPPFSLFGVLPWRIKDRIDRSFMATYQPG